MTIKCINRDEAFISNCCVSMVTQLRLSLYLVN